MGGMGCSSGRAQRTVDWCRRAESAMACLGLSPSRLPCPAIRLPSAFAWQIEADAVRVCKSAAFACVVVVMPILLNTRGCEGACAPSATSVGDCAAKCSCAICSLWPTRREQVEGLFVCTMGELLVLLYGLRCQSTSMHEVSLDMQRPYHQRPLQIFTTRS